LARPRCLGLTSAERRPRVAGVARRPPPPCGRWLSLGRRQYQHSEGWQGRAASTARIRDATVSFSTRASSHGRSRPEPPASLDGAPRTRRAPAPDPIVVPLRRSSGSHDDHVPHRRHAARTTDRMLPIVGSLSRRTVRVYVAPPERLVARDRRGRALPGTVACRDVPDPRPGASRLTS